MRYMRYGGDYEIEDARGLLLRAARLGRHLRWAALWAFFVTVIAILLITLVTTAVKVQGRQPAEELVGDVLAKTISAQLFTGYLEYCRFAIGSLAILLITGDAEAD